MALKSEGPPAGTAPPGPSASGRRDLLAARLQLALLVLGPLAALTVFAVPSLRSRIHAAHALSEVARRTTGWMLAVDAIHAAQVERGREAMALGSPADRGPEAIAMARRALDASLARWDRERATSRPDRDEPVVEPRALATLRERVDAGSLPATEHLHAWQDLIERWIDTVREPPGVDVPARLADRHSGLVTLLELGETTAVERGVIAHGLAAGELTPELRSALARAAARQARLRSFLPDVLGDAVEADLSQLDAISSRIGLGDLRGRAVAGREIGSPGASAEEWFAAASERVDLLSLAARRVMVDITDMAREDARLARRSVTTWGLLYGLTGVVAPLLGARLAWSVHRTIAGRERARSRLEELNREKNLFVGIAAHDLRNPLGVIVGSCGLLRSGSLGDMASAQRDLVERMERSGSFMLTLVNDLLDIAAIEAGTLRLEPRPTDLSEVVRNACAVLHPAADTKGIELIVELPLERVELLLDESKMVQVLQNLIGNAIKFSESGSAVRIAVDLDPGHAVVRVVDQGIGIPEDVQQRMFQPFQRGADRGTAGERSTGLGLAIAKRIVDGHGARMWLDSAPGKGTTFFVALPLGREGGGRAAPARQG